MNENERLTREVVIANRTYPLKIYKQDEERILNIVKTVNEKIEQLRSVYDAKDNQDYLAMCLLQIYTQSEHTPSNTDSQLKKIEELLAES